MKYSLVYLKGNWLTPCRKDSLSFLPASPSKEIAELSWPDLFLDEESSASEDSEQEEDGETEDSETEEEEH